MALQQEKRELSFRKNKNPIRNAGLIGRANYAREGGLMTNVNTGIYKNILDQLDKLFKHNRQGSIKTKERYYQAMQRFCRYLANEWRLQKLANIAPKHVVGYASFLKANNKSASTIKTDLSAIRFFHDKISEPRFRLPDNSALELSRRKFLGFNRTWSEGEYAQMITFAHEVDRSDYACAMTLAYHVGLRIHECCRIDTAAAASALKCGTLTVKGKNGKIRTIPINEAASDILRKQLAVNDRGSKLIVPDDTPTHVYIKRLQSFIGNHRSKLPSRGDKEKLTMHGLRHSFAVRRFSELIGNGYTESQAKREVSRLLGHEREDVTEIYLSSLRKGGEL